MTRVPPSALASHDFLRGMSDEHLARLAAVTSVVTVPAGHRFFTAGTVARRFWLIRAGQVALDVDVPGQGRLVVETLGRGELIGVSWFVPPFYWQLGAVAMQPTEAFELDAVAIRKRCDEDPGLGYQITPRLAAVIARRLQATRLRMIEFRVDPDGVLLANSGPFGPRRPPQHTETETMPAAYEEPPARVAI